jgi:hypothetical protein
VTLTLLATLAVPCRGAEPEAFRFSKEVLRTAADKEQILAVPLDAEVYAGTRNGMADLRVFGSAGAEVTYVLEKATETRTRTVRRVCPSRVASLHEQDDGIELVVEIERDEPAADGLSILTPLRDYERRVRVLGSRDGTVWAPLTDNGLVFDYSRYMDVSNHEIRLPKNDFRQLKIIVAGIADAKESPFLELTRKYRDGGEAEKIEKTVLQRRPFRMDRIELWHEAGEPVSEHDKQADYPVAEVRQEEDAAGKRTIVYVRTHREPLTQLSLETGSRNFSRAVVLERPEARAGRSGWAEFARGRISLVDFGGYRSQSLAVDFRELREAEIRIVIHNEDNPPLRVTGVRAQGNVYRVVFLAAAYRSAADESYRLAYGSDEAEPPRYDTATVLAPLRPSRAAVEARLGPETAAPAAAPPSHRLRDLVNNRLLLGGTAVVVAAALAWALFQAAKRINKLPNEP